MLKGENITLENLSIKRPGYGIPPKYFEQVLGRSLKITTEKDHVLKWEDLI